MCRGMGLFGDSIGLDGFIFASPPQNGPNQKKAWLNGRANVARARYRKNSRFPGTRLVF
jgi:hypothetical protein